ncbi:MAG: efflux RND transporter periplasmic adaptor subunit [Bacteroidales bacterium]|nr:efflux RND transporter periplasmic adaptor subunit [Bacteroidales bacterium]
MNFKNIFFSTFLLVLTACHNHSDNDHHHDDEEDEVHHHNANVVEFHDEVAETIDFKLDTVSAGRLQQTIHTTAQIIPALDDEHIIVAKARGIITLGPSTITGNRISAGQVIASTNSQAIEGSLRMQQEQAQAELQRTEAEYNRKLKLANEQVVTQSDLNSAKAEYLKAKAALDDIISVATNGRSVIRASETEYIRHLYVQNGQFVNPGDPIASVSHNMRLYLQADVQPRYYKQLQQIAGANINIDGIWHDISDFNGRFVSCGRSTSPNSPLLPVIFEIDGSPDFVAGTFVDIYIKTRTFEHTLSIPSSSLIEEMGDFFVFVNVSDEHYEKREVKIGQTDGYLTEIISGLSEGEVVVSRGAVIVKLAMSSGSLDAHSGHVH